MLRKVTDPDDSVLLELSQCELDMIIDNFILDMSIAPSMSNDEKALYKKLKKYRKKSQAKYYASVITETKL